MMKDLYCAVCGHSVPLDDHHVSVEAELKRPRDRNGQDDYVFHAECWERVTGGWMEPA